MVGLAEVEDMIARWWDGEKQKDRQMGVKKRVGRFEEMLLGKRSGRVKLDGQENTNLNILVTPGSINGIYMHKLISTYLHPVPTSLHGLRAFILRRGCNDIVSKQFLK